MKLKAFLFVFVAILSCRAESSTAKPADRPAQKVESVKPAQTVDTPAIPAKAADAAAAAKPAAEAPKNSEAQKPAQLPMLAMVVTAGIKPSDLEVKKDLADLRAEQQATMAQQLASEAQSQKAAMAGMLTVTQSMFSLPTLSNVPTPVIAAAPVVEIKNPAGK